MTISVSLLGGRAPQMVQIAASAVPVGTPWRLVGRAGDDEWVVPGGEGIGNGGQISRADNRAALNVPVVYVLTAGTRVDTSLPIIVEMNDPDVDVVFDSLDGSVTVRAALMDGSQSLDLDLRGAEFEVAGRERPVRRYDVTSDGAGELILKVPFTGTPDMRALLRSGASVVCRFVEPTMDFPLVQTIAIRSIRSRGLLVEQKRLWVLGYTYADDPYLDIALGGFSWDEIDAITAADTGPQMEAKLADRAWNEIDVFDWSNY